MTIEQKNTIRFRVRMFGLTQWGLILLTGVLGWMVGKPLGDFSGLLTASTTGMTTLIGLDYFSKPTDTSK